MAETEQQQTQVVEKKGGMDEKQERTLAMLCHLGGLLSFLPALIIWLIKKDESEFIDDQGKEALNFQISITIYFLAAGALIMTIVLAIVGMIAITVLPVFYLIMIIIATVKANNGEKYRYPLCIRFIK